MGIFGDKKRPEPVESIKKMSDQLNKFHPSTRLNLYDEEFDQNDQQRRAYRRRLIGRTKRKRAIIDNI